MACNSRQPVLSPLLMDKDDHMYKHLAWSRFILLIFLMLGCLWMPSAAAQNPLEWTEPRPISPETEHAWGPTIAADASGTVHAFWSGRRTDQESEPQVVLHARYQAGRWTEPMDILMSPNGKSASSPRSIVDGAGRIHVFWSAPGVGPFGPLYHSWAPVSEAMSARSW